MMTSIRTILLAGLLGCGMTATFVACSDDNQDYVPVANSIRIVQNDLIFQAEGNSSMVLVEGNGPISATVDADWCQVEVSNHVVSVTVEANYNFEGRTALLTISDGSSSRQLPVQQLGMVLDMPMVTNGHHSPINGEVFTMKLTHNVPMTATSAYDWIHPEVIENAIRVKVDSNVGGHIRRGTIVCKCGDYIDTLRIGQYDMQNDVVGSYYMMGYYGGNGGTPTATRFDIIQRHDSLFMHWPQERYADAYIHIPFDEANCSLFIPSGFTLYNDGRTSVTGYFYDTNGSIAVNAGTGINARLYYSENTGYNAATPTMANWAGHTLSGFILRSTSLVSTTLLQLGSPVLMRVGPVGATIQ